MRRLVFHSISFLNRLACPPKNSPPQMRVVRDLDLPPFLYQALCDSDRQ
jgi:hypothetical protein